MASKTNRVEVPEAKAAMDRFKTEVASELGVNLKEGYNGDPPCGHEMQLPCESRHWCRAS